MSPVMGIIARKIASFAGVQTVIVARRIVVSNVIRSLGRQFIVDMSANVLVSQFR